MEDETSYVYFSFTSQRGLKELMKFHKSDYEDYGHFVGGITRFFPHNFFFKEPVPIESCTIEELDRVAKDPSITGEDK
jgi:hypothetical protein